jgi:hypothetical protein
MRLQLALNVENIDESVEFYSKMFDTTPYKTRPGYANFEIDQPPLKLVLFENPGNGENINHLGVEVESADQVEAAEARITGNGLGTTGVEDTLCCYAAKTETWVEGPNTRWEWYVKNDDVEIANIEFDDQGECACEAIDETVSAQPAAATAAAAPSSGGCC